MLLWWRDSVWMSGAAILEVEADVVDTVSWVKDATAFTGTEAVIVVLYKPIRSILCEARCLLST